jgi:hypothetical protein
MHPEPAIDTDQIDDAVPAGEIGSPAPRAWKTFDWPLMARLYEKG